MKVAISSSGKELNSAVDRRFGRTTYFIVCDTNDDSFKAVTNNQNLQAEQGAGIQSAKTVADTGAQAVITGNVGPKAFQALSAAKIQIYLVKGGTVKEALEAFKAGKLSQASGANVEGHWV